MCRESGNRTAEAARFWRPAGLGTAPPSLTITPNDDGRNDRFVIRNIENRPWQLTIVNRWGQQVYESRAYQNDWDGGNLPPALYYYRLYNDTLKRSYKGWVQLYK